MMNESNLISLQGAIDEAKARLKSLAPDQIEIAPTKSLDAIEGLLDVEAWNVLTVQDKRSLFLDLIRHIKARDGKIITITFTF
jgi:hypothetical protein